MHNQNSCENRSGLPIYAWRWLWKLFAVASAMLVLLSIASSQDDSKLQADSKLH